MSRQSVRLKRWCGLGATAVVALGLELSACSSDPPTSSPGVSNTDGGDAGSPPAPSEAGMGPVTPSDTEPPTFDGLREATVVGETRVQLAWDAARDDDSPAENIAYAVYVAKEAGKQDFSQPLTIAPAGSEGALISGLTPSTEYFFVVRAVDQAGNEDENHHEASALTEDQSPPSFAGITKLTAATSHKLLLEWKPARDKGAKPEEISYRAYVSDRSHKQNFDEPSATSEPGANSVLVEELDPLTDYFAVVRAVDADGNEDENSYELSVRTPEGVIPTFGGAKRALGEPAAVRLYWAPGSDNVTEVANLVYDIFIASQPGKFDFTHPDLTSPPGVIDYLVEGLTPGQRYYFVVRARDVGGNTDNNTFEVNAKPLASVDKAAPSFNGVTSVTGTSPSTLLATWSAATDDQTLASEMVYEVYVSDSAGTQDFRKPQIITPPGATSATVTRLPPGAVRYFVVRARDKDGNVAPNKKEVKGTTLASPDADTAPPVWGTGPTAVTKESFPYDLDVAWGAATDAHAAADIRYHLCAEPIEANCVGLAFLDHIRATSDWGDTAFRLTGLSSRTTYFVYVRAEDRSGNLELGEHGVTRTTLTSWATDVEPIFAKKCLSCHKFTVLSLGGASSNRVLGSYFDPIAANIDPSKYGEGLPLVDPGNPEFSLLYRRINPVGLRTKPFSKAVPNNYVGPQEPRDGSGQYVYPLSGSEDGAIRDWIEQGAFATN